MNCKRNKDELSLIAKKIFDCEFKRKALEFYEGANTRAILKYDEWEERCKKLLHTFFTRAGTNSRIILFPDIEIAVDNHIHQVEIWGRILRTLNDWSKTSSPKDATGLVIRNYDIKNHLYFRGITED